MALVRWFQGAMQGWPGAGQGKAGHGFPNSFFPLSDASYPAVHRCVDQLRWLCLTCALIIFSAIIKNDQITVYTSS